MDFLRAPIIIEIEKGHSIWIKKVLGRDPGQILLLTPFGNLKTLQKSTSSKGGLNKKLSVAGTVAGVKYCGEIGISVIHWNSGEMGEMVGDYKKIMMSRKYYDSFSVQMQGRWLVWWKLIDDERIKLINYNKASRWRKITELLQRYWKTLQLTAICRNCMYVKLINYNKVIS